MSNRLFSLNDIEEWLATKDPETEYDYGNAFDCFFYRYLRDRGVDVDLVGGREYDLVDGTPCQIPEEVQDLPICLSRYWQVSASIDLHRKTGKPFDIIDERYFGAVGVYA